MTTTHQNSHKNNVNKNKHKSTNFCLHEVQNWAKRMCLKHIHSHYIQGKHCFRNQYNLYLCQEGEHCNLEGTKEGISDIAFF